MEQNSVSELERGKGNGDWKHPIRLYIRYLNKIHVVLKLSGREVQDMVLRFSKSYSEGVSGMVSGYNTKKC
jgi:pre-mRNA-processing factor 8